MEDSTRNAAARAMLSRPATGIFLPLERETAFFVLVSGLDLVMTCLLISRPHFTEANPVALYFLGRWGIAGMAWFKLGMVAIVGVLTQTIARQKPETARFLLNFATVCCVAVILYSLALWIQHH